MVDKTTTILACFQGFPAEIWYRAQVYKFGDESIGRIYHLKELQDFDSLITDHHLNIIESDSSPNPNVWAIEEAAVIEGSDPLLATVQVAYQKGTYLARDLIGIARSQRRPE
ncbi:hypothetical protein DFS33DRAFT_210605 [Desarmillaria ectypa]|nr:hypothetical protein DFS33DRAFT_210605 [Desarmillaria ectypa]